MRGVALQAMISGVARWPSHREKRWIDKSMGRYRLDRVYARRLIESGMTRETAVARAATDRGAAVRRLAVIALLTDEGPPGNFDEIARLLRDDPNTALREWTALAIERRRSAVT
ncbi:MAG: hypothetical protein EOP60_13775 [Sphingomonadales bacterium]|nr:MAG: hypothetical protein EOP60_13775 [Sphingomonadales bacterium]